MPYALSHTITTKTGTQITTYLQQDLSTPGLVFTFGTMNIEEAKVYPTRSLALVARKKFGSRHQLKLLPK